MSNRRTFLKLSILIAMVVMMASGCERTAQEDVVKIGAEGHALIKEYDESQGENLLNDAVINLRSGNNEKAIEKLNKFVTYYPTNSVGQFYLGKAYFENNEPEKSLFHIKQALTLDPDMARELAGPVIGKNIIGRVFVTNEINESKNLALKPRAWFDRETQNIYASIEIINASADTEIEAEWVYELSNTEKETVNLVLFKVDGSKTALVSLKKPVSGWPAGKYVLKVFVNGKKNTNLTFYVF